MISSILVFKTCQKKVKKRLDVNLESFASIPKTRDGQQTTNDDMIIKSSCTSALFSVTLTLLISVRGND